MNTLGPEIIDENTYAIFEMIRREGFTSGMRGIFAGIEQIYKDLPRADENVNPNVYCGLFITRIGIFKNAINEKLKDGSFWKEEKINYKEYIKSPEWKARAKLAKEKAGMRCQLCNKKGNMSSLHAHHRTYERLGDEYPDDLIVLCANCHAKFHDKEYDDV